MGFVSYLEDIKEKMNDLENLLKPCYENLANKEPYIPLELVRREKTFLRCAEAIRSEITQILEIATDPKMDLSWVLFNLRNQSRDLKKEIESINKAKSKREENLERDCKRQINKINKQKNKITQLEGEKRSL